MFFLELECSKWIISCHCYFLADIIKGKLINVSLSCSYLFGLLNVGET